MAGVSPMARMMPLIAVPERLAAPGIPGAIPHAALPSPKSIPFVSRMFSPCSSGRPDDAENPRRKRVEQPAHRPLVAVHRPACKGSQAVHRLVHLPLSYEWERTAQNDHPAVCGVVSRRGKAAGLARLRAAMHDFGGT